MDQIKLAFAALAFAGLGMLSACSGTDGAPADEGSSGTTGGETTGGETTGGETTGGETTGGETTGGETTGGETTGGETTGGETTGGETTGGSTTGGSTGGESARACFNPELAVVGTRVNQVIRSTDGGSGITLTATSDTLANQMTTYNGHNALESISVVDAVASDPTFSSKSTTKSYIAADADSSSSQAFGTVTQVTMPIDSTISITIDPPRQDHYDLDPGQSYTQTYTVSSSGTASAGGISVPIPGTSTSNTVKRTYVGRESLTVPAGTFETCHFQEDVTIGSTTGTSDMWFTVGSGIQIKVVSDGDESVTLSASINGTPID